MPRPLKFPGLQPKFEGILLNVLEGGPQSGGDIQEQIRSRQKEYRLSDAEREELEKNFANYISRAKETDVIRSGGPWAGYQLVRVQPAEPESPPGAILQSDKALRRPNEAAMHLVATCGLSLQFGARIQSLRTSVDALTWANADMLMLRENPSRKRLEDYSNLKPEVFRLADSSPDCILSSIELKYGLERSRKLWFQAVAETAANSRWANESILVHIPADNQVSPVDEEVISLARSAEVGIVEFSIALSSDIRRSLETRVISPPQLRPFLRLAELSGDRKGLLENAHELLQCWHSDVVTFLDEEGAPKKLLQLLRQSLDNLRRQSGFSQQGLAEALTPLNGDIRIRDLYRAALDSATTATDSGASFVETVDLLEEVMNDLPKKEYDLCKSNLAALKVFANTSKAS